MANGLMNSLKFVAAGIALSSASAAFATCGNNGCGTTTPPKPTTPTQPTQPIYNTPSAGAAAGANAGAAAGAQAGAQSGSLSGAAASNQADLKASQTANQNTQVGVGVNSSNKNDLTANAAGGAAKSDANATGGAAKSDSSAVAGDSAAQAKTGDVTVGGSKIFTFNAGNLPGVAGSAISGPAVVQLCQTSHSKDTGGMSIGLGGATPNGGALNLGYSNKGETINDVKPDEKCYEAFMAHEKAMADKAYAAAQKQATVALDRDMLNKGPVGMALVVEKNYKDQAAAITAKDSPTAKLMGLFAQPTTKPVVKKPAAKKDPCVKSVNVCKPQ